MINIWGLPHARSCARRGHHGRIENPHYSDGAGSVIFKGRVACTGAGPATIRMEGFLEGFGGTPEDRVRITLIHTHRRLHDDADTGPATEGYWRSMAEAAVEAAVWSIAEREKDWDGDGGDRARTPAPPPAAP